MELQTNEERKSCKRLYKEKGGRIAEEEILNMSTIFLTAKGLQMLTTCCNTSLTTMNTMVKPLTLGPRAAVEGRAQHQGKGRN